MIANREASLRFFIRSGYPMFVETNDIRAVILHLPNEKCVGVPDPVRDRDAEVLYIGGLPSSQGSDRFVEIPPDTHDVAFPIRWAIRDALKATNAQPSNAIYVTSEEMEIVDAVACRLGTVLFSTKTRRKQLAPDFAVSSIDEMNDILSKKPRRISGGSPRSRPRRSPEPDHTAPQLPPGVAPAPG